MVPKHHGGKGPWEVVFENLENELGLENGTSKCRERCGTVHGTCRNLRYLNGIYLFLLGTGTVRYHGGIFDIDTT